MHHAIESHTRNRFAHQSEQKPHPPGLRSSEKTRHQEIEAKAQQLPALPLERPPEIGLAQDQKCAERSDQYAKSHAPIHRFWTHLRLPLLSVAYYILAESVNYQVYADHKDSSKTLVNQTPRCSLDIPQGYATITITSALER